uniref:Uncharacterized protein n=1 Tax=Myoviridae sp. ctWb16 TaxID=2827690 RepID=A0A8S5T073_9CAUD|nr:MAG TPA: hypothetical protein [Myoviridae sp. ctWb16]
MYLHNPLLSPLIFINIFIKMLLYVFMLFVYLKNLTS